MPSDPVAPAVSAAATASAAATVPELTVVVPTFNERDNVRPMVEALDKALRGIRWEVLFVDDDSPDGTGREVRAVARERSNVRLLHRIGRRGLAGACIEGILSSISPLVAVIDADMQHDETRLAEMFAALRDDPTLDLVIGSRHVEGGAAEGGFSGLRAWGSRVATRLARKILRITASDPMSGFFMVRRERFNEVVLDLQPQGFKILADMLAASGGRWKLREIGYEFRARQHGESKLDSAVTLEFLGLIVSRLTGGLMSIRLVLFLTVGLSGVAVQLVAVKLAMLAAGLSFGLAQSFGVWVAMTSNFLLNNALTYHDRMLRGVALLRGLVSFYAVCLVGAVANVGVAEFIYGAVPLWVLASVIGAVVGALWNFIASALFTWRVR